MPKDNVDEVYIKMLIDTVEKRLGDNDFMSAYNEIVAFDDRHKLFSYEAGTLVLIAIRKHALKRFKEGKKPFVSRYVYRVIDDLEARCRVFEQEIL